MKGKEAAAAERRREWVALEARAAAAEARAARVEAELAAMQLALADANTRYTEDTRALVRERDEAASPALRAMEVETNKLRVRLTQQSETFDRLNRAQNALLDKLHAEYVATGMTRGEATERLFRWLGTDFQVNPNGTSRKRLSARGARAVARARGELSPRADEADETAYTNTEELLVDIILREETTP